MSTAVTYRTIVDEGWDEVALRALEYARHFAQAGVLEFESLVLGALHQPELLDWLERGRKTLTYQPWSQGMVFPPGSWSPVDSTTETVVREKIALEIQESQRLRTSQTGITTTGCLEFLSDVLQAANVQQEYKRLDDLFKGLNSVWTELGRLMDEQQLHYEAAQAIPELLELVLHDDDIPWPEGCRAMGDLLTDLYVRHSTLLKRGQMEDAARCARAMNELWAMSAFDELRAELEEKAEERVCGAAEGGKMAAEEADTTLVEES